MISVIIPVYNCENYIDSTLQSLWNQTCQDFEVICVNDGSTDDTLEKLKRHAESHSQLKIHTIVNSGPSVARNTGIELAKGKYICFIDSDDQIESCYLMDLLVTAEKNQADLAVCHIDRVYETEPGFLEKGFRHIQNPVFEECCTIEQNHSLLVHLLSAPFAKLIRKEFIEAHQLRFLTGKIAQDFLFTKSMLVLGARVAVCPHVNYHYQVRKGSITTGRLDKALDLAYVVEELLKLCIEKGVFDTYRKELEYLCLYHLGIDMSYRLFKASRHLPDSLSEARKIMKKYGFSSANPYVNELNWLAKLYLKLFF